MTYPSGVDQLLAWTWADIQPHYQTLVDFDLTAENFEQWLKKWDTLSRLLSEMESRVSVRHHQDTTDAAAEADYDRYHSHIAPAMQAFEQKLHQKLVDSGIHTPDWFATILRDIKIKLDLFHEDNLPLIAESSDLCSQYDKIVGAQTAIWQGEEVPLMQLKQYLFDPDRSIRQTAWVKTAQQIHADHQPLNDIWRRLYEIRLELAANVSLSDFRDYRWQEMGRLDYTPDDCKTFYAAVESVILPIQARLNERRRQQLGVDVLRPWDMLVDPHQKPPLKPYATVEELEATISTIFHQIHPQLGSYIDIMRGKNLLDLANRPNKVPVIYCTQFYHTGVPFIFGNAIGLHDDVTAFIHEAGHAFHTFEMVNNLDYVQQMNIPMEAAELASQSLELLTLPYLHKDKGGFYDDADLQRVVIEQLERVISLWLIIAKFGIFQDAVYDDPALATDLDAMNQLNLDLTHRFEPGVDYSGYEHLIATEWQDVVQFFHVPFYFVDYGLAYLGAVDIWRNSLENPQRAIDDYLAMLALGNTRSIAELYKIAGTRLAFDEASVREAAAFIETQLDHYGASLKKL